MFPHDPYLTQATRGDSQRGADPGTIFTNAATGAVVRSAQPRSTFAVDGEGHIEGSCGALALPDSGAGNLCWPAELAGTEFVLVRGPDRLLSEYLQSMQADGYVIMPALLAPQMMRQMKLGTHC